MVQPNTSLKCLSQHRAGGAAVSERKVRRSGGQQIKKRAGVKGSVKGQKPAVYVAFNDFTHDDVMAKAVDRVRLIWLTNSSLLSVKC